jgi:hypothetical protein
MPSKPPPDTPAPQVIAAPVAGPWLRTPAAAEYCGIAPTTLETLRVRGGGPAFSRLGRRAVVYAQQDLDQWIAARRSTSTAAADALELERDRTEAAASVGLRATPARNLFEFVERCLRGDFDEPAPLLHAGES